MTLNWTPLGPPNKTLKTAGEEAWKRAEKVNGELFVLTYGAIVAQLCRDLSPSSTESFLEPVNEELYRMGISIGGRLIEDFLAKAAWPRCADFTESVQVVSAVAFKMFLNCTPRAYQLSSREFSLRFGEDEGSQLTLLEFVHLPESLLSGGLKYVNILPGLLRGAFSMIQIDVDCWIERDQLRGDEFTEIRLRFNRLIEESLPPGE